MVEKEVVVIYVRDSFLEERRDLELIVSGSWEEKIEEEF